MSIRLLFSVLFSGLFCSLASGQDYIEINTTHRCIYHGTAMPEELYSFEASDSIEQLKDDILKKTAQILNFEFICSNVPSVAAVVDKNKRYVLYSRKFFSAHQDLALRYAILAHEIGHHVNGHLLKGGSPTEAEEMEADEFAGYTLCLTGVPAVLAEQVAAQLSLASGIDSSDRKLDIMRGFLRAEASLRNAEHAAWFEENINEVIKNFPKFPFPTPTPSAEANLDVYFNNCNTLADADKKISRALESAGYSTRRYLYVPDGFALVTRMEQFNRDGACKGENSRWSSKIVRCEDFSTLCYPEVFVHLRAGFIPGIRVCRHPAYPDQFETPAYPKSGDRLAQ
ncbi:MAG: hypothetical protein IPJ82_16500 [Lewinellaceae bacterium]|nr:hypothetical protein [Lewinellaceae bacterium]